MSSPFSITALADTVTLDDEGHAVAVFTVSNDTGSDCEIRASVENDEPSTRDWLVVSGEHERPLSATGSEQYVVDIRAPESADPGDYHFRLRVIDLGDPDDKFSVSPNIAFEVPEPEPVVVEEKPFPWWIVAVAAVVLIIGGVVGYLALRGDSELELVQPADESAVTVEEFINGLEFSWDGGPDGPGFALAAFVCFFDGDESVCPLTATAATTERAQILSAGSFVCEGCETALSAQDIDNGLRSCAADAQANEEQELILGWGVVPVAENSTTAEIADDEVGAQVALVNELSPSEIVGFPSPTFPVVTVTVPPVITVFTIPPLTFVTVTFGTTTTTTTTSTTTTTTVAPPPPSCDGSGIFVIGNS